MYDARSYVRKYVNNIALTMISRVIDNYYIANRQLDNILSLQSVH